MRSFFDIVRAITFQHLVHLRKNTKLKTTFTTPEKAIKSAIDFSFFQWACSFQRIQKQSFDLRFAGVRCRKESDIRNWICNLGNLSRLQYAWQPLKKRRVFYLLGNYAIIPCRILWSAVRIATMEHKQIKKGARQSWKLYKGCRLCLIQFRSSDFLCIRLFLGVKLDRVTVVTTSEFVER